MQHFCQNLAVLGNLPGALYAHIYVLGCRLQSGGGGVLCWEACNYGHHQVMEHAPRQALN